MGKLYFVEPSIEILKDIQQLKDEHIKNNEITINGAVMLDQMSVEDWLAFEHSCRSKDTVQEGWVDAATAVAFDEDGIVGIINMRNYLNDFLRSYGGHVGYCVTPSRRGHGYAKEMLKHALEYYRLHTNERKIMLSCDKDNIASKKTILACGGEFEKEFLHEDGNVVEVYWITINQI